MPSRYAQHHALNAWLIDVAELPTLIGLRGSPAARLECCVVAGATVPRLLLDPSLLLSEDCLTWLQESPTALKGVVVSAAFDPNNDRLVGRFLSPEEMGPYRQRQDRVTVLLREIARFSSQDPDVRSTSAVEDVGRQLRLSDDVVGRLLEDEWVYLQSASFMASAKRHLVDAVKGTRTRVFEYGRDVRDQFIRRVIKKEHIPDVLTDRFLWTRVAPKFLVLGGVHATAHVRSR